jgi:hypothetical protein
MGKGMSFDDLDDFSSLPRLSFNKIKPAKKIRSPADRYPCAVCAYLDPAENPLTGEYEPCTHRTRWQKTFKTKRMCAKFKRVGKTYKEAEEWRKLNEMK